MIKRTGSKPSKPLGKGRERDIILGEGIAIAHSQEAFTGTVTVTLRATGKLGANYICGKRITLIARVHDEQ